MYIIYKHGHENKDIYSFLKCNKILLGSSFKKKKNKVKFLQTPIEHCKIKEYGFTNLNETQKHNTKVWKKSYGNRKV